ncbi:hypothetical protein [Bowmanella yangjiangensis]|uniref:Uncharacterized protein n=1 Tax=Bowmanella yangjiangensis TaxID=2811230 RepID=A0ABS3CQA8_9ALTE|nr:hypothetical protein [Bowmanella yangjiangensis]MBN7818470.1 hypothetical protein [Bowmanella yangjiangensis]
MSAYDLLGAINSLFIFISVLGVYSQLRKIWGRKRTQRTGDATAILSLNQFTISFLAYFSFFVYGYSLTPVNHYLLWPRLAAAALVVVILYEIFRDRRSRLARFCFCLAIISLVLGIAGFIGLDSIGPRTKLVSTILIVAITLLLAQGYAHQILLIIRSGSTGAVDIRMSQFILMMDISTIAFACSMGVADGWPLLLLACVSGITKLIIMYLFFWVRVSPRALARRETLRG